MTFDKKTTEAHGSRRSFLFRFIHFCDLLAVFPHFISHIGRVNDLRPSAEAEDPGIKHFAQFHFCGDCEVTFIHLLILCTGDAELIHNCI